MLTFIHTTYVKNILSYIWNTPKYCAILMIRVYQHTLSLDHGPLRHIYPYGYCRHSPSCSEFSKQKISKHGFCIGVIQTVYRILHCHPWAKVSDQKILEYYSAPIPKRTRKKS